MSLLKVCDGTQWVAAAGSGPATTFISPNAPLAPTPGMFWYDSDDEMPQGVSDTGWIRVLGGVGFQNGWVDFDTRTVVYRRKNGIVYLQGIAKSGPVGTTVFNLPAGFRPRNNNVSDLNLPVISNAALGMVTILGSTGAVGVNQGSNLYVDFGSITFPADN